MSNKSESANQRLRILYLYKILMEKTDNEHSLTIQQLGDELAEYGFGFSRKTFYDDIEALREFGADIIGRKTRMTYDYFIGSRDFELPELKLLADAVCSAKFLTEKKSEELLKKIEGLASIYEGKQIQRQIFISDRVKALNERIYLNVDTIHRAINEGKMISFSYFDYGVDKKKKYRDGKRIASPYALTWSDERYYLVAFYRKRPNNFTNFRVDRMEMIEVLDEDAEKMSEKLNLADYLNSSFSMFSGTTRKLKLKFHNSLVNVVFDRFGKDVNIVKSGDEHFNINVDVKAEPPFFGWLFQFGDKAKILEPPDVRREYSEMLKAAVISTEE